MTPTKIAAIGVALIGASLVSGCYYPTRPVYAYYPCYPQPAGANPSAGTPPDATQPTNPPANGEAPSAPGVPPAGAANNCYGPVPAGYAYYPYPSYYYPYYPYPYAYPPVSVGVGLGFRIR